MGDLPTVAPSFDVPIADVVIGDRRREDFGDIDGLARSIERYGLLHPIVLDGERHLIAGERRLKACQSLGWSLIQARAFDGLTDAEKHEIELEENLRRKDLTPIERSRVLTRLADTAAAVLRDQGFDRSQFSSNVENNPEGRPPKPDAINKVAERSGIPLASLHRAKAHVAAVETYPELAVHTTRDALTIAKKLDAMPEPVRLEAREAIQRHEPNTIAELTDRPPLPPGPTPHELAQNDPGRRFNEDFHKLIVSFNAMKERGGLGAVISRWSPTRRAELLGHVSIVLELATEWQAVLQGVIADEEHDAGSIRESDGGRRLGLDRSAETAA